MFDFLFSSHFFLCSNTDTKSSLVCSALSSDDYMRTECDISVSRLFPIFLGSRCWYQRTKKVSVLVYENLVFTKKVANLYQKISCPKNLGIGIGAKE